jgi:Fur family ferric uptake transcriptional regulator
MGPADWEATLRSRGYRITAQRLAILHTIATSRHPTAESIFDHLRHSEPALNLSTVYRNLAVLQEVGLVTHAHFGSGAPIYHLADEPPHIHLSCLRCGRVTSVGPDTAAAFARRVLADTGFVIDTSHSAVHGLCRECSTSR